MFLLPIVVFSIFFVVIFIIVIKSSSHKSIEKNLDDMVNTISAYREKVKEVVEVKQEEEKKICEYCGSTISKDSTKCDSCGAKVKK